MSTIVPWAHLIDHTLLKPQAVESDFRTLCQQAMDYHFKAVCLAPCWVPLACGILQPTEVKVCTVVGFPWGYEKTTTKMQATDQAINDGATEIDMVINQSWFQSKMYQQVEQEISELVKITHQGNSILKVIVESCLMNAEQIKTVTKIVQASGADFIKTSTGFSTYGARVADISIMLETAPNLAVKASGGIKTLEDIMTYQKIGVQRIGMSAAASLIKL